MRKSANRLSPATKLFGYGRPLETDRAPRKWHCPQIDAMSRGERSCFLESQTCDVSPVWAAGTTPWQAKQSSAKAEKARVFGSTAVVWQPAQRAAKMSVCQVLPSTPSRSKRP